MLDAMGVARWCLIGLYRKAAGSRRRALCERRGGRRRWFSSVPCAGAGPNCARSWKRRGLQLLSAVGHRPRLKRQRSRSFRPDSLHDIPISSPDSSTIARPWNTSLSLPPLGRFTASICASDCTRSHVRRWSPQAGTIAPCPMRAGRRPQRRSRTHDSSESRSRRHGDSRASRRISCRAP